MEDFTLRDCLFIRTDAKNLQPFVNGRLRGKLENINMEKMKEFSGGEVFTIYENVKEYVLINVNNGRNDNKWSRSFGCFAKMNPFRYVKDESKTVIQSLNRVSMIYMENSCSFSNYLPNNSLLFFFQNDIFDCTSIGGQPIEQQVETDIDSFYLQNNFFRVKDHYTYVINYWENIFDTQQLKLLLNIVEDIIVGIINGTVLTKDLRNQISKKYFTSCKGFVRTDYKNNTQKNKKTRTHKKN
ncbi:hypothetical protein PIROE2DRAFT_14242 [Piromyces sp. E2]|nr:hypothetical protein PIROE2DRAFT_14242 [Piromyces sp. E2]|eukprot:OUM60082.1 hypothetical protein PIROE2DRAFT_14242 [Piromyces sp. E2]